MYIKTRVFSFRFMYIFSALKFVNKYYSILDPLQAHGLIASKRKACLSLLSVHLSEFSRQFLLQKLGRQQIYNLLTYELTNEMLTVH